MEDRRQGHDHDQPPAHALALAAVTPSAPAKANFDRGEKALEGGQLDVAIAAYNAVIQNYPMGNAVPDAYYKRGLAQERLGQLDAARESWNTALKNYPDSTAGGLAKQSLDRNARRPSQ